MQSTVTPSTRVRFSAALSVAMPTSPVTMLMRYAVSVVAKPAVVSVAAVPQKQQPPTPSPSHIPEAVAEQASPSIPCHSQPI